MKLLAATSRSATFELDNPKPFYSGKKYTVFINGEKACESDKNVFSLFSLTPDTEYAVEAFGQRCYFKTAAETAYFDVSDFGAVGDGVHDDTPAFCAAIACLPVGGTLFVPAGKYFLTPIFLKSNITLYLDGGAVLLGNPYRTAYPKLPALCGEINLGTWQGEEAPCFASMITAYGCENVTVTGNGTVDCNALAGDWYENHRVMRGAWRPRGIFLNRCKNVLISGITVKDTPSWNVHPYFSDNIKLYDLKLKNTPSMPTTDGVDPDACDGVEMAGLDISVGDDCIAIKSGTLAFAQKYKRACRNITVRNCLMREGHGGVVFGSELSGGIENVTVTNCLFVGTDRGFRIKTRRGRGRVGITDNIVLDGIEMRGVKVPFVINMYYNMGDETGHTEYVYTTEKLPVDDLTPFVGAFTFKNMTCDGVAYCAGAFYGLPEAPIKSVTLENVTFSFDKDCEAGFADMKEINEKVKNRGLYFQFTESVVLKNVKMSGQDGEPVVLQGVENFTEE